ncbi:MAG TPA: phosphatidylglycerol lysyltransferase domain-containing protein [Candidatus Binatia bacterium]|nr:phosphatidylglycerol lysyltransferase domain-containing protein [Candidatus Binatia bacterium]
MSAIPGAGVMLAAIHPGVLTAAHHPILLGRSIGPLVLACGLVAAVVGSTLRFRPLLAAAVVALPAGVLSVADPQNLPALGVGLAAMLAAVAVVAARAATHGGAALLSDPTEMERLRLLHGRTHISCFAGDRQKRCLASGGGAVAFQVRWGVAVSVGDPLAQGSRQAEAAGAFLELCGHQSWIPCFFQTDASLRGMYRGLGLRILKFGEEAVVDLGEFDLRTPARADVRHELARARRAGLEGAVLRGAQASETFWAEAAAVSRAWLSRRGGREMGFSLGRFQDTPGAGTWYTVARDREGRLQAFCSWVGMGSSGIALDLVRRSDDAAPGAADLCIATAIEVARGLGLSRVLLGTVPFRESLGDAPDGRMARGFRAHLYRRGWRTYSYRGLSHFKAKFATGWESRDVALPAGPATGLALAALVRLHLSKPSGPAPPSPAPLGLAGTP